jgi:hypothetical protein
VEEAAAGVEARVVAPSEPRLLDDGRGGGLFEPDVSMHSLLTEASTSGTAPSA